MKSVSVEEVVKSLRAFELLETFALNKRLHSYECDLTLKLCKDPHGGEAVSVTFFDVSNLSIRDAGGGYIQLLSIQIEDIRARQMERKNYRITQLEDDKLEFDCADFTINEIPH